MTKSKLEKQVQALGVQLDASVMQLKAANARAIDAHNQRNAVIAENAQVLAANDGLRREVKEATDRVQALEKIKTQYESELRANRSQLQLQGENVAYLQEQVRKLEHVIDVLRGVITDVSTSRGA